MASEICLLRISAIAFSSGDNALESCTKSPRWESSSSPTGASMETGSWLKLMISVTRSSSSPSISAISLLEGSLPSSCVRVRRARTTLLIVSTICTGTRIVFAWSAIARVIAWRIHHVAYVENLNPFSYSNLSTAFIRPIFPSWIRSRSGSPLPTYFLAILTTSLRLASISSFLASGSPSLIRLAIFCSSSMVSRRTCPIVFKYWRTGSVISAPSITERSSSIFSSESSSISSSISKRILLSSSSSSSTSSGSFSFADKETVCSMSFFERRTSILLSSKTFKMLSNCSEEISTPENVSRILLYAILSWFFLPCSIRPATIWIIERLSSVTKNTPYQ